MHALAAALAFLTLAAGPPSAPPRVAGAASPPPAWFEAGSRSVWASFGSYCWSTACVDMIPPERRADLARLPARPGMRVSLRLRFAPKSVRVFHLSGRRRALRAAYRGRVVPFSAREGIVEVEVRGSRGSASYLVRIV